MKYYISKTNILKKLHRRKGGAIIAVLCVLAVLFALTASLLLATNVIVNNNSQYKDQIQCKLAANSFSKALQDKLADDTDEFTHKISAMLTENWKYYNDSEIGHGHNSAVDRTFTVNDGDIVHEVLMYHESDVASADDMLNHELVIEVTTKYKNDDDLVYKIISRFNRTEDTDGSYHWYLSWSSSDK